ncbi:MAG TPA: hypothetical protein VHR66_27845 [Gemmataceae bacterium]|nr:hypothetical protein [Gemmataceae bacterium]
MIPTPEEVQLMLRAEPFQPLQVRLTDGTTYFITNPKLNMVTRHHFLIGSPDPTDSRLAKDIDRIHWSRVASVVRLVPENTVA